METEPFGYLEMEDEEGASYRWPILSEIEFDSLMDLIVKSIGNPDTIII